MLAIPREAAADASSPLVSWWLPACYGQLVLCYCAAARCCSTVLGTSESASPYLRVAEGMQSFYLGQMKVEENEHFCKPLGNSKPQYDIG